MSEIVRPVRFSFSQVRDRGVRPGKRQVRPLAPTSPRLAPGIEFPQVIFAPDLAPTSPPGTPRPLAPAFIEGGARANLADLAGRTRENS